MKKLFLVSVHSSCERIEHYVRKQIQKRSIVGDKYFERKNKDLESDYDLE